MVAVGELHGDGPAFADDVQVGGDEAVGRDDEAGAQAVLLALAAGVMDDDDGRLGRFGELLDGFRYVIGRSGGGLSIDRVQADDAAKRQGKDEMP